MKAADLRGILQYVPQFKGRTFVIAVDGAVIASQHFSNILLDLAVLRSLNVKVVLVHGASHQIEQLGQERGIALSSSDGTGVTDRATHEVSMDAIARLTSKVMQDLTALNLRAATANALIAHPAGVIHGIDQQFTGRIDRVDAESLQLFLKEEMIPIIPPLGYDRQGQTWRLNSDLAATEVALALGAHKIIFLTTGMSAQEIVTTLPFRNLQAADRESLEKIEARAPFWKSKLEYARRACQEGVPRVHLLSGTSEEALLAELFSPDGIGVMIHADDYQQLRPLTEADIPELISLIHQSVEDEALLKRTREDILLRLKDYYFLEIDGHVVGSVAVHSYPDEKMAELACLYIKKNHENRGYGTKLITFAQREAKQRGAKKIFALTTQAASYFQHRGGFYSATSSDLPAARQELYAKTERRSHILLKEL